MNATRGNANTEALRMLLKAWHLIAKLPSRFQEQVWRRILRAERNCGSDQRNRTRTETPQPIKRKQML
jgi:hypothetical protein